MYILYIFIYVCPSNTLSDDNYASIMSHVKRGEHLTKFLIEGGGGCKFAVT